MTKVETTTSTGLWEYVPNVSQGHASETYIYTLGVEGARNGDVTHGKQKGVKFIIKVL